MTALDDTLRRQDHGKAAAAANALSSVEEAAALLGTSITRLNDVHLYRTTSATKELHSGFSTVKPVPCSELYMRLSSLVNRLQTLLVDADKDATHPAAPSIIPLLHKLFGISSSLALTPILLHSSANTIPASSYPIPSSLASASSLTSSFASSASNSNTSTATPQKKYSPTKRNQGNDQEGSISSPTAHQLQVPPIRILPPLCSKAIRHLWVQCLALAHRLSSPHSLPSTNPHVILAPYFQLASCHPRSSKSAGGSRVAALSLLTEIFHDDVLGQRYIRPLLRDVIVLAHNGLKSSGATDVVHRKHSVELALSAVMAWRDCSSPIIVSNSQRKKRIFTSDNFMEEKVLAECVRLLRKGADDKYPEVRLVAAQFAAIISSVSVLEEPRGLSSSSKKDFNGLLHLDEIMAICYRNLDDESVGVSVKWSEALARCICSAVEYHTMSEKNQVQTHTDRSSGGKHDFTSKLKAFQEARRVVGTIGSVSCVTLESAMMFLVQQFSKAGGEGASKLGGSNSMGGRHVQVGISLALIDLCKLQLASEGIGLSSVEDCMSPSEALMIILRMVGDGMETNDDSSESASIVHSLSELDDSILSEATSSSKKKKITTKSSGVGGFLRNMSSGIVESSQKLPTDASLARQATARVLRRGLSGIMSETMQLALLRDLTTACKLNEDGDISILNRHQLQVAMIEISHLITALGEASASCLEDLLPSLQYCLSDSDHGVRYEAATAFQAVVISFPSAGRKHIMTMVGELQMNQDEILSLGMKGAPISPNKSALQASQKRRRSKIREEENNVVMNENIAASLSHQYAINGNSLALSMILHVMPHLSGGLPSELLDIIIAVAENLVSCQGNANLLKNNPGALVTCVRAGYHIICSTLTMGSKVSDPHKAVFFRIWSRSATLIDEDINSQGPGHSMSCLELFITSILVFLRSNKSAHNTDSDTLKSTLHILEKLFPIVLGYSQSEDGDLSSTRLDTVKASIMEAFTLFPASFYPSISSSMSTFALRQIQTEIRNGNSCSILHKLLSSEDELLVSRALTRTERFGETGSDCEEENMIMLTSKFCRLSEREAVMHLYNVEDSYKQASCVTKHFELRFPKVEPEAVSRSAKERLLNSAICMFASTFDSLDSHQQASAVKMLDSFLETRSSSKDVAIYTKNITATILSCLLKLRKHSSMPNDEDNSESDKGMTQSMTLFAKILLAILPISDDQVRRAAAEGLGVLSSLSSTSETNKLQRSILIALERTFISDVTDNGAPKQHVPTPSSASAGFLLALASIQRSSVSRLNLNNKENHDLCDVIRVANIDGIDATISMINRLLPYIATQEADFDSHVSRTYAIHSFLLFLSYSGAIDQTSMSLDSRKQILSKAVEVVENNFFASWITNDGETDVRSLETERASFEPALLSALIRLMKHIVPRLYLIQSDDRSVTSRFSTMVMSMISVSKFHSSVVRESLKFFHCLSEHNVSLEGRFQTITGTDPRLSVLSISAKICESQRTHVVPMKSNLLTTNCESSLSCQILAVMAIRSFIELSEDSMFRSIKSSTLLCQLFDIYEEALGRMYFFRSPYFQGFASPFQAELYAKDAYTLLFEAKYTIRSLFLRDTRNLETLAPTLDWLLLLKTVMNTEITNGMDLEIPLKDILISNHFRLRNGNCFRWQFRYEIIIYASKTLRNLHSDSCQEHFPLIRSLISTACTVSTATYDQSELFTYQKVGLDLLRSIISVLSQVSDPVTSGTELLEPYISQILPAVKHALSSFTQELEDMIEAEGAKEVYLSGCKCLQLLVRADLIQDLSSLKRLLKAVLPSQNKILLYPYPKDDNDSLHMLRVKPSSFIGNRTSNLLCLVGSLWTVSNIFITGEMGFASGKTFDVIKRELNDAELALSVSCAVVAIDACRIKGATQQEKLKENDKSFLELQSSLLFSSVQDLDNSTREAMKMCCSSTACFAFINILRLMRRESEDNSNRQLLTTWISPLIHVILAEFYSHFDKAYESVSNAETFSPCILVLRVISRECIDFLEADEIERILRFMFQIVEFRGLSNMQTNDHHSCNDEPIGTGITFINLLPCEAKMQACAFIEAICKTIQGNKVDVSFLWKRLLESLLTIERSSPSIFLRDPMNVKILNSILVSTLSLLQYSETNPFITKCMLMFLLNNQELITNANDSSLKATSSDLIQFCISADVISDDDRTEYSLLMAKSGNWDTWLLLVNNNRDIVSKSIGYFEDAICNDANESLSLSALDTILLITQDYSDLAPMIFGSLGPIILEMFQMHGNFKIQFEKRTLACATCIKIIISMFQYTLQLENVTKQVAFLHLVFQVLTEIISYNGLPNDEKTNPGSDPTLGRICAQFCVHVLRSSPTIFKECMATVDGEVRGILETAIRADMSGYASRAAPVKKKLNLKAFQK